jgi:hypothetical protein
VGVCRESINVGKRPQRDVQLRVMTRVAIRDENTLT